MTESNLGYYNATYTDVVLEPEKLPITDEMMLRYFESERDRTMDKLRWLDRVTGRKQTIPRRVR